LGKRQLGPTTLIRVLVPASPPPPCKRPPGRLNPLGRQSVQPTLRLGVVVAGLLPFPQPLQAGPFDDESPVPPAGLLFGAGRLCNQPASRPVRIGGARRAPLGHSKLPRPRPHEFFFVQTAFNIAMLPRLREENTLGENTMIKLIAAAGFLVAVATSAHAITPAPIPQPDGMLSQVRLGCGPFRTRVAGICVARTTIRHTRRLDRRAYRRGY
jgi:hypothetical protein